ncbi:hypothetical protein ANCCEY_06315 [Ancylostoma ceylanicum]|uniref:NTR domain-containing protein n=1 Tax=Ancylostoma ceylanicum TaxID=53326 RepID=A0A0D6LRA7_9BILA|nr:hypothetical protein ANCCEY_06315 [Ancylostoma ceylanicum]
MQPKACDKQVLWRKEQWIELCSEHVLSNPSSEGKGCFSSLFYSDPSLQLRRVYTVEHKKVYKNSSELPTKIVTTQKCGIKLRNGTEYLIGAWYTDYANHGLYIVKCDLRKKWNNVTEEDRDKLEKYYSSNYTCPEPVEYEDDF